MNKMALVLVFMMGIIFSSEAQQAAGWCGSDYILEQALLNNPNLEQELFQSMLDITAPHTSNGTEATKIVPVVVHVLHDDGIGNISYEQIQDALDILNIDYNRLNPDTALTRETVTAPFKQYAASMDIEFKLARFDPNGECTNGVIRHNVPDHVTYDVDMNNQPHKHSADDGVDAWPRNKYLNIWIVNSIAGTGLIIGGYAQFPYFGSASEYGIVIRHNLMGSIGTASGQDGSVLTHELGHCLGLYHIFQGGCHSDNCNTNGDWCCDTPPQDEAFFNCSQTLNSCSDIPTGDDYGFDALDQIENYMSYNSCWNMFSQDQAAIMDAVFTDYSWAAQLISPTNIAFTGVDVPDALCRASFTASQTSVCTGTTVDFTDETFNSVSGWNWTFTGGTPASSTAQNPSIVYNTPGLYEVRLDATDGTNSDLEVKTAYIRVLPAPATLPFLETFENYSTLLSIEEWEVVDFGNNAMFELTSSAGHISSKSAKLDNFGESAGNFDELISSPVDLSGITTSNAMTLSFRYAYRKRNVGNDEWLKIYVSSDCGATWVLRKTIHGAILGNSVETNSWTPSSTSDWTTVHMTNITSLYWVNNFKYKFEFESDGGNNFFLDNINIHAGSADFFWGLDEETDLTHLAVYPNPVDDELNLSFDVSTAQKVEINVQDLTGKVVNTQSVQAVSGSNLIVLKTADLASGMYFLKVDSGRGQESIQFVVK